MLADLRSAGLPAALLAGGVLLSRLPFLHPGYGHDSDAWRVVQAARYISETGRYGASRLPGHPVQEILYSFFWRGGDLALNGVTAVLSALAVVLYLLALRRFQVRNPLWAGAALAAVPVVYINSTTALDYVWALALSMAAFYLVGSRRPLWAGLSLGVATGIRLTAAALGLPLAWLLITGTERGRRLGAALAFAASAAAVGAACYLPVVREYGPGFLRAYQFEYPNWVLVGKQATLDVWGAIGLVAVAIALVSIGIGLVTRPRTVLPRGWASRQLLAAATLVILIYSASYAVLPLDSGYLLPAVPFVLLVFALLLPTGVFRAVCVLICLSPFFLDITDPANRPRPEPGRHAVTTRIAGWPVTIEPLRGPVLYDHARRLAERGYVARVLDRAASLEGENVVVAFDWLPQIELSMPAEYPRNVRFVYLMDRATLAALRPEGVRVHFLPAANAPNALVYGFDLEKAGAEMLAIDGE